MKTMSCRQLGGACDKEFRAASFAEIAEMSKQHGMEMFQSKDAAHAAAMNEMRRLMQTPESMAAWFEDKKREFDAVPEDL
jgi:predicted small metal-binding protein